MIGSRLRIVSLLVGSLAAGLGIAVFACGGSAFTSAPAEDGGPPATTDAATPRFCATDGSVFDFCADFDEPLPGPWGMVPMPTGGATLAESDDASTSPPASLLASSPEVNVIGSGDAGIHPTAAAILQALTLPKGQTHIQFDFRIDELSFPNGNDVTASVVPLAYTQGNYSVYLAFRPVAGNLAPFGTWLLETVTPATGAAPVATGLTSLSPLLTTVGSWVHVEVDFDIDDTLALADGGLEVQGTVTVTGLAPKIVTMHPPLAAAKAARTLVIGVASTAAANPAKVRFDNVTYSHTAP